MRAALPPGLVLGCALAAAAACGREAPPPVRAGGPLGGPSPAASPDDVVVATVDDRPVWGSCVAAQAARGAKAPRAALDECIDFELLARAAEARGLAGDPSLGEAIRAAMVGRLVETAFEARYRSPADLRDVVERVVDRYRDQLDKPELRASSFARVEVPKGAPPEADAAARELAEQIAGELAGQTGLFPVHLRETADRLAAGTGQRVSHGDFRAATFEGVVPPYAEALFAIPEVGRVSKPARTEWGWDVILMTQRLEPRVYTREEVAAEVFPDLRRQYFQIWVNQIARSLGVKVQLDEAAIARLEGDRP